MEVKLFFLGNIYLYLSWNIKIVFFKLMKIDYDSEFESLVV